MRNVLILAWCSYRDIMPHGEGLQMTNTCTMQYKLLQLHNLKIEQG
jgi:hypothetical protein